MTVEAPEGSNTLRHVHLRIGVPLFADELAQHLIGLLFVIIRSNQAGGGHVFVARHALLGRGYAVVRQIPPGKAGYCRVREADLVELFRRFGLQILIDNAVELGRNADFRDIDGFTQRGVGIEHVVKPFAVVDVFAAMVAQMALHSDLVDARAAGKQILDVKYPLYLPRNSWKEAPTASLRISVLDGKS